MSSVRRVVTGHDASGKAVFTADEVLELTPFVYQPLWGSDHPETFPNDGVSPTFASNYPPVGGYRFFVIEVPAGFDPKTQPSVRPVMTEEMLISSERAHDAGEGMHWTETIDFIIILTGELVHELESGEETVLRAGDTLVQNGAVHRWRNTSDQPATFAFTFVGTHDASGRAGL